ncbi:MAG: cytochrome C [Denitrovibrio sp.]|nr:MAG: cytochrome C [Denitrovibrio sp.]
MKKFLITITFLLAVVSFAVASADGEAIYAKCKGCHGADGSKKAMGTGLPLKGQSEDELISKLKGYKDGSYGGAKKAIMASQAKRLSDKEIEEVSEYISKF